MSNWIYILYADILLFKFRLTPKYKRVLMRVNKIKYYSEEHSKMSKTDQKKITNTLIGAVAGVIGVYALRSYVDKQVPSVTIMPTTLKGFSVPSAYGSILAGGGMTAYELNKVVKKTMTDKDDIMAGMGAALLLGGVASGLMPASATTVSIRPGASSMRYIPPIPQIPRQMQPIVTSTAGGYPNQPNGNARGRI